MKQRRKRKITMRDIAHRPSVEIASPAPAQAQAVDGSHSIEALVTVLQALTNLPSDRSKARVLKFVQDYFDEAHDH